MAWGLEHRGFYVDPQGRTCEYKKPNNWTFPSNKVGTKNEDIPFEYDLDYVATIGSKAFKDVDTELSNNQVSKKEIFGRYLNDFISPEDLLRNLSLSTLKTSWFREVKKNNPINFEIIDDLIKSNIEGAHGTMCDAGFVRNCIWIFDNKAHVYKSILLKTMGDRTFKNTSEFTDGIIQNFGEVYKFQN